MRQVEMSGGRAFFLICTYLFFCLIIWPLDWWRFFLAVCCVVIFDRFGGGFANAGTVVRPEDQS